MKINISSRGINLDKNKFNNKMLLDKIQFLEDAIALDKSFLDMIFDTIPNPIFYKDRDGIYRHCNDAFSKIILGIEKEEILGKTLYDIPDRIPKELADIYNAKDKELLDNPSVQNYEAEVKCADNIIRYYNFYKATFLSNSQEVLGLVGVMLDISEQKKAIRELDKKNKILNKISIKDPLTKLYNRRFFEEAFQRKRSMLMHHNQAFALLLIDIDFFKDYNDTFGHPKGDKALVKISNLLQESFLRPTDYVFRLGGEEFGILFHFNTEKESLDKAKKLLKDVENLGILTSKRSTFNSLTISMGASIVVSSSKKISLEYMYKETDKLLYKAKYSGRNQMVFKVY